MNLQSIRENNLIDLVWTLKKQVGVSIDNNKIEKN